MQLANGYGKKSWWQCLDFSSLETATLRSEICTLGLVLWRLLCCNLYLSLRCLSSTFSVLSSHRTTLSSSFWSFSGSIWASSSHWRALPFFTSLTSEVFQVLSAQPSQTTLVTAALSHSYHTVWIAYPAVLLSQRTALPEYGTV